MDGLDPGGLPCPRCGKTFNHMDFRWACPKCKHVDQHWGVFLNCGSCGCNPAPTDAVVCPHCKQTMQLRDLTHMDW